MFWRMGSEIGLRSIPTKVYGHFEPESYFEILIDGKVADIGYSDALR